MNTSAMIVEMIIIGFQIVLWLAFGFAMICGIDLKLLADIEPLLPALAVALLPLCYSVGLIVDGAAAPAEDVIEDGLKWLMAKLTPPTAGQEAQTDDSNQEPPPRATQRALRQWLRLSDRELYADLDRDAYLLRLIRSTFFIAVTATIILLSAIAADLLQGTPHDLLAITTLVAMLIAVNVMAGISWQRRKDNFRGNRAVFYQQLRAYKDSVPGGTPPGKS